MCIRSYQCLCITLSLDSIIAIWIEVTRALSLLIFTGPHTLYVSFCILPPWNVYLIFIISGWIRYGLTTNRVLEGELGILFHETNVEILESVAKNVHSGFLLSFLQIDVLYHSVALFSSVIIGCESDAFLNTLVLQN